MVKKKKTAKKPVKEPTGPVTEIAADTKIEPYVVEPIVETVEPEPAQTIQEIVAEAPEIKLIPTQRWYGETFYPAYKSWLEKLKAATGT